jgi:hypothetical protein
MTQEEWLTSTNLRQMWNYARWQTDSRRLRLFVCACCRQAWNRFVDPFTVGVVSMAEAFADGKVSEAAFARLRDAANAAVVRAEQSPDAFSYLVHSARSAAHACADPISQGVLPGRLAALRAVADLPADAYPDEDELPAEYLAEHVAQADLLRDIFGNPFRPVELDPAWLASDVLALARSMYANREFSAMPILADALQDAGCDSEDVLSHCRGAGPHVRGCWVVDLLLGKK